MSYWRTAFPDYGEHVWREMAARIILITGFVITEDVQPFWRQIQQEEVWMYKYPNTVGYVSTKMLYIFAICACLGIIAIFLIVNRNVREAYEALLVPSLAIPLSGLLTNFIKISVASFCAMGFVALYLAGKLCCFNARGRGRTWRLILAIIPLCVALLIAISRTCDYHHHWQDVTVGSILGLFVATLVYRQYYPSLTTPCSPVPYAMLDDCELENVGSSSIQQARFQLVDSLCFPD